MGLERLLPEAWRSKATPGPGPKEQPTSGETSSVGGQSQ